MYMRGMTSKVKQMKQEGKPMPKNYQDLEREFGEILRSTVTATMPCSPDGAKPWTIPHSCSVLHAYTTEDSGT